MEQAIDLAYGPMVLRSRGEHRRMEEESSLKADLLDLTTDAIYVTDLEGNFIYVNDATCQSSGYSREGLLNLNLQQLITPEYAKGRPQRLRELLEKGELIFESTGFHKDGSVWPFEIHARMIEWQGKKVILNVARDITERRQAKETKTRMEALGTFSGGIAHEFNNVLMAIAGYIELAYMDLEGMSGADKVQSKLEAALQGTERARNLVKQILTFVRHNEEEARPLEILPIVKAVIKLLRASIPDTIEICQNLDPQSGEVVADPVQVHQILMNLSSNAYQALREKEGILEINLEPAQLDSQFAATNGDLPEGEYLRLTVRAAGPGLDQETLGRIFDPSFTTKGVGEGNGSGLSLVQDIVKKLGGAIGVSNESGKGSAFLVYLPRFLGSASVEVVRNDELVRRTQEHIQLVEDRTASAKIGQ